MSHNSFCFGAICILFGASAVATAQSFPIAAPGTEGLRVIVSLPTPVVATYLGNSASYSNDLFFGLSLDDANHFVFNNHETPVGTQVTLGSFPIGTELIFRLYVRNTGYSYFTGPGERNPDGRAHARVQAEWQPSVTLVSFEDLYNGPFSYNDLSFSFTSTDNCVVVCDAGGPYFGHAGVPVQFDATGCEMSPPGCGTIVSYAWDFGDGNAGSGVSPDHVYGADGIYEVTLCVTDDRGNTYCCSPESMVVPTRHRTWGQIKARYR